MALHRTALALCLAPVLILSAPGARATCSDLSLVLAVDDSSSIDADEYQLQIQGYSKAFADPAVQRAIAAVGRVDVAVVFWADSDFPFQILPWHSIRSAQDATALAAEILHTPRRIAGDTDLGAGLNAALDLLDRPDRCTARAVINVSGDGRASKGPGRAVQVPLPQARARAARLGVMVNGLAIVNAQPALAEYYRDNLITGIGSFVMSVSGFDTFGAAIQKKLIREIAPQLAASLEHDAGH